MTWSTAIDPALCWRLCLALAHSLWQLPLIVMVAWLLTQLPRVKQSLAAANAIYTGALVLSLLALPATLALVPAPLLSTVGEEIASAPSKVESNTAAEAPRVASDSPEVAVQYERE